jgi:hypothetical protein
MISNINQFTQQLRMLPDQVLQRVAMMYKQDPYILPMVIAEDAARKKMRMAARAQMAQPQPKVVDQAVASLGYTPEEVGIASLPAQNMQGLADGGIAGYAEGGVSDTAEDSFSRGGMFDFTQRSEPVVRMADGGEVQRFQDQGLVRQGVADPLLADTPIYLQRTPETEAEYLRRKREAELEGRPALERLLRSREDISQGAKFLRGVLYPEEITPAQPAKPAQAAKASAPVAAPAPATQRTPPPTPQQLERAVGQRSETPPAASDKAPTPEAPTFKSDSSLYSLDPAVNRRRAREFMPTNEYETAYNVQTRRELERLEAREAERERNKPTGKAREGLEALLKKESEGEAKEKSDAGAFALISAGLAIASGESPNALMNIAKGLNIGAKEYQAAIKDFKKASRERKLMMADIEEARRLEAKGDYDKAEERKDRVDDRRASIERYAFSGIMQLKLRQDELAAAFGKEAQAGAIRRDISGMDIAAAQARLNQQLAAPTGEMRLMAALDPSGKGNIARGFEAAQAARREPMTREKLFLDYMKNPLADPNKFGEYVQQYERQFGPLGGIPGAASQSADQDLVNKYLNPPR